MRQRVNLAAAWNLIVVAELFAADEGDLLLRTARNRLAPCSQE